MDGDLVLVQDRSSGAIHKRVREGRRLLSDERCQADQSGASDVIFSTSDADPEDLCRWCFPVIAAQTDIEPAIRSERDPADGRMA